MRKVIMLGAFPSMKLCSVMVTDLDGFKRGLKAFMSGNRNVLAACYSPGSASWFF